MSQESGKENGAKSTAADSQESVESLKKSLATLQEKNDVLLKETLSRKEKLELFEKDKSEKEKALLAEQGKYKELYESLTPKANRLDAILPKLESLYQLEVADIPEDKRDLIPALDVEGRLEWVKNAKSKGLFVAPSGKNTPVPSAQNRGSGQPGGQPEFVTWSASDPRITKLSPKDMQIWRDAQPKKSHSGW